MRIGACIFGVCAFELTDRTTLPVVDDDLIEDNYRDTQRDVIE